MDRSKSWLTASVASVLGGSSVEPRRYRVCIAPFAHRKKVKLAAKTVAKTAAVVLPKAEPLPFLAFISLSIVIAVP